MVQKTTGRKMQCIKGFSELKAEKIKEAASKAQPTTMGGFITGMELKQNRKKIFRLSTGCKAFDAVLGG
jgi:meiotic recombination protein DMC1